MGFINNDCKFFGIKTAYVIHYVREFLYGRDNDLRIALNGFRKVF